MDALRGSAGGIILIIENNLFKFNFGINQKKKKKEVALSRMYASKRNLALLPVIHCVIR